MRFDIVYLWKYFWKILPYLRVTLEYAGLSLLFGLIFGSILAAFKLQKYRIIRYFGVVYTAVFRSIPPVVLLFLVYYGLPQLLLNTVGIDIQNEEKILYVIITISILSMVSLSEVIRSAYTSIDKGQYEAAISSGLLPIQAMVRIVIPQMIYVALPNIGNIVIYLIKEGSLGFTIGLVDVFGKANSLNQNSYSNYILEIYTALALIYWFTSILLEKGMKLIERRVSYGR